MAVADISTMEIYLTQISNENLRSEIAKLKPKEIIIQETFKTKVPAALADSNSGLAQTPLGVAAVAGATQRPGIKNYNVSVKEQKNDVVFLHKIIPSAADRSYGIHAAKLAGMPADIIAKSGEILSELQSHSYALSKREIPSAQADFEDILLFDKLKELDVNKITPVEALNIFSDLTLTRKPCNHE